MNAKTTALKSMIDKGLVINVKVSKLQTLELQALVTISGGDMESTMKLPIFLLGDFTSSHFSWHSSERTRELFISAVNALCDDAEPSLIVDTIEWVGGGLILCGDWATNPRGRAKDKKPIEHHQEFLIDAGFLESM